MKTARILFGTGPLTFKIGCAQRIGRSRAGRTGLHGIHMHMTITTIP
jgi:hypothetical protein